jgi:hypothetical protein
VGKEENRRGEPSPLLSGKEESYFFRAADFFATFFAGFLAAFLAGFFAGFFAAFFTVFFATATFASLIS